jgi:hypothetical protein
MVMGEIFFKISNAGLTPNAFYVLYCIHYKIKPDKSVNASLEITKLKSGNYLTESLELSGNSLKFMQEIEGYFKKSKKKTSQNLLGDDFLDKIKQYNECFPASKLPSGVYARVNVKSLENAFRWFFETFDYSWDIVIQATEKYVEEYSINRYNYMRNSQYFVRKQNTDKTWDSNLATYCDMISQDDYEAPVFFKEKIV